MNIRGRKVALSVVMALGASFMGAAALAQESPQGMMGGQQGMGPGMMMGGQQGMGPGMMMGGQHGMGPGMMMGGDMTPCPMMGMGGAGMGMPSHGDLTDEQREEMRQLMQEHRPTHFERMGQLMNLREDLMLLLSEASPDPEQVQELHGRMADLHGEMLAEKVRHHNSMHDLLTEEQRDQLREAPSAGEPGNGHSEHH